MAMSVQQSLNSRTRLEQFSEHLRSARLNWELGERNLDEFVALVKSQRTTPSSTKASNNKQNVRKAARKQKITRQLGLQLCQGDRTQKKWHQYSTESQKQKHYSLLGRIIGKMSQSLWPRHPNCTTIQHQAQIELTPFLPGKQE